MAKPPPPGGGPPARGGPADEPKQGAQAARSAARAAARAALLAQLSKPVVRDSCPLVPKRAPGSPGVSVVQAVNAAYRCKQAEASPGGAGDLAEPSPAVSELAQGLLQLASDGASPNALMDSLPEAFNLASCEGVALLEATLGGEPATASTPPAGELGGEAFDALTNNFQQLQVAGPRGASTGSTTPGPAQATTTRRKSGAASFAAFSRSAELNQEAVHPLSPIMEAAASAGATRTLLRLADHEPALLNAKGPSGLPPALVAYNSKSNGQETARTLLTARANVNACTSTRRTLLHSVAAKGDAKFASELLKSKAMVDARTTSGLTPILAAAKQNNDRTVFLLLGAKADVTASMPRGPEKGKDVVTYAVEYNNCNAVVRMVHMYGVDIKATPHLLPRALQDNSVKMVQLLLELKVDPNTPIKPGVLPLRFALSVGYSRVIPSLLLAGATIQPPPIKEPVPLTSAELSALQHAVAVAPKLAKLHPWLLEANPAMMWPATELFDDVPTPTSERTRNRAGAERVQGEVH